MIACLLMGRTDSKEELYDLLRVQISMVDWIFALRRHIKLHHKSVEEIPKLVTKYYLEIYSKYQVFFMPLLDMTNMFLATIPYAYFLEKGKDDRGQERRNMHALIIRIGDPRIEAEYCKFVRFLESDESKLDKNETLMGYIKGIRNNFFAHAGYTTEGVQKNRMEYYPNYEAEYIYGFVIERICVLMLAIEKHIDMDTLKGETLTEWRSKTLHEREIKPREIFMGFYTQKIFESLSESGNRYPLKPEGVAEQYRKGYDKFDRKIDLKIEEIEKLLEDFD